MAKKKVIVKKSKEDLEKEEVAKKAAKKEIKEERVKGKKSKKKQSEKTEKPAKSKKKSSKKKLTKEESEKTSGEIDALSIDEVAEELDVFDEDETSDLEREVQLEEQEFEGEEIQEERIYTVPLAKKYRTAPNWNRTKKAVKVLREFMDQHMKPEVLYISPEVNERLWEDGIKKPPRKIRVRVTKSVEGLVRVFLA